MYKIVIASKQDLHFLDPDKDTHKLAYLKVFDKHPSADKARVEQC